MHIHKKSSSVKQSRSCIQSVHRPGASRVSMALAGAIVSLALANPAHAQRLFALHGHGSVHPGVTQAHALAHLDPDSTLDLAISLPVHNQAQLDQFLQDIYNPGSPNYRKYLSSEEFNSEFGPTEDDYAKAASFLKAHGFTVKQTYKNRMIVDVSGSVSTIEQAFHVKMYRYQHPTENRTFFGPDREPSLDQQVPILDVVGLDNYELPKPSSLHLLPSGKAKSSSGSSPYGTYIGKDFRAAYTPGSSLDGTGQTIALFQLGSYYPSDIASYCSTAGIPSANVTEVLLDGVSATPAAGAGTLEQALDIEMAHSMAPGANIRFYYGTNAVDVWNQIASDNIAKQVSSSWSVSPPPSTLNQILEQMASQGQSVFNASGDSGFGTSPFGWDDNPYMTSVGATELSTSSADGPRTGETAASFSSGYISPNFSIPYWQQGISMSANGGSTTQRNCPDVAMVGDSIYEVWDNGTTGGVYGTSAAAPLWAGYLALANQQAARYGKPTAGFINPAIYALGKSSNYAADFLDITSGNNGKPAVSGYDLVTGWGSPAGQTLIDTLSGTFGSGAYFQIINQYSGLAIDLIGGNTANGAVTNLWTPDTNSANQRWALEPTSNGQHYKIISFVTGKALSVANDSNALGTQIWDWDYNNDSYQMWNLVDNGGGWYRIKNAATGLVLDDDGYGTSNNTELDEWSDNLTNGGGANPANQAWSFQSTLYGNTLYSPGVLSSGHELIFGTHTFVMQGDGNLVEYNGSTAIWASGTSGHTGAYCAMQPDGNLVVYDLSGAAIWSSGTYNNPGAYVTLQSDGNVVVYSSTNSALWATGTQGR